MRGAARVVGSLEKDQVTRFRFTPRDDPAALAETFRRLPADTPAVPAVIDHPGNKARAVKARAGGRAAPDIRIAKVLFAFRDHPPELFVSQGLSGDVIVQNILDCHCVRVVPEDFLPVSVGLHQHRVPGHFIFGETGFHDHFSETVVLQGYVEDVVLVLLSFGPGILFTGLRIRGGMFHLLGPDFDFLFNAAATSPTKSGCGAVGRDLNSGWNWHAMK